MSYVIAHPAAWTPALRPRPRFAGLGKIRAEDGRCVNGVDISPFIDNLPFGKATVDFETPDASGSTSQATNIIEAIEAVSPPPPPSPPSDHRLP